jgi:hypothetical protein
VNIKKLLKKYLNSFQRKEKKQHQSAALSRGAEDKVLITHQKQKETGHLSRFFNENN